MAAQGLFLLNVIVLLALFEIGTYFKKNIYLELEVYFCNEIWPNYGPKYLLLFLYVINNVVFTLE